MNTWDLLSNSRLLAFAILASVLGLSSASAQLLPISGVTETPAGEIFGNSITTNVDLQEGPGSVELGDSDSLATSTTPPGNDYWSAGTTLTFNLSNTYNLTNLLIWNGNQNGFQDFGAQDVLISFSTTGTPGSYSTPTPATLTENTFLGTSNGTYNVAAQIIGVSAYDTQYVQLTLVDNFATSDRIATYGNLVGLNEVNFVGTEFVATPEPSTYAMMLAGLAVLGFCVRRKGALLK